MIAITKKNKPFIAVTMGDPAGIGPEVIAKALLDPVVYDKCNPFVIGNAAALKQIYTQNQKDVSVHRINSIDDMSGQSGTVDILDNSNLDYSKIIPGKISAESGKSSVEWVLKAGEMAINSEIQAIVTAPINKEACRLAGYKDIGHMEIFHKQSKTTKVATMLMAEKLRVVHLTTHKSLRLACEYVTKENILSCIILTHQHFQKWGFSNPIIAVAALNPHASDGGLIGDEENTQIAPAVKESHLFGINAIGPVPADAVFNQAIDGMYDVVIAMYHDQGHIPIKVHNWEKSVSLTLGLPFIRTSVDHGTAFDISGKNVANPESMMEAIRIASGLASDGQLS